jgi:mono/diheme cytochrome c family protein
MDAMTVPRLALAVLASLALVAAGCGGGSSTSGGGGDGQAAKSPRQLFADTCGGCHTLKAAGTEGQVGPNLDELKPTAEQVKMAIEQGPSVMPDHLLKGAQADAVAKYVAEHAGT